MSQPLYLSLLHACHSAPAKSDPTKINQPSTEAQISQQKNLTTQKKKRENLDEYSVDRSVNRPSQNANHADFARSLASVQDSQNSRAADDISDGGGGVFFDSESERDDELVGEVGGWISFLSEPMVLHRELIMSSLSLLKLEDEL